MLVDVGPRDRNQVGDVYVLRKIYQLLEGGHYHPVSRVEFCKGKGPNEAQRAHDDDAVWNGGAWEAGIVKFVEVLLARPAQGSRIILVAHCSADTSLWKRAGQARLFGRRFRSSLFVVFSRFAHRADTGVTIVRGAARL